MEMPVKTEDEGHGPGHEPEVLTFANTDPENPYNWSLRKKLFVVICGMLAVLNSTFGSSLPSNAINYIGPYFHVSSQLQLVLPISLYLVGYVLGPFLFGPLSEEYGRRVIMLSTFLGYTIFTMASAVSPNWPSLLVFRLLSGIFASCPISVVGGLYADIFNNPIVRGRAMAIFMASTMIGPTLGPIVSGYVAPWSWRWAFWIGLILAGICFVVLIFLPETYAPVLLKKRAQQIRKETGSDRIFGAIELEKRGAKHIFTVVLMRPVNMIVHEAIVFFTCAYLSLAYAIFYLFFEAYPIIFEGTYHMNTGAAGLAFIPILVGSISSLGLFFYYDSVLQKAKNANKAWAQVEEYRRLPLSCLGGPLYVISLLWLGWTSRADIHWIVPMLAGIPFGCAYLLIFIALLNYITDAYEIYAASAMAAASGSRSIFGALLPLAAHAMYERLGIAWASSLLGFASLALTVIPFAFIRYGESIRARSKFRLELQETKEKEREKEMRKRVAC